MKETHKDREYSEETGDHKRKRWRYHLRGIDSETEKVTYRCLRRKDEREREVELGKILVVNNSG